MVRHHLNLQWQKLPWRKGLEALEHWETRRSLQRFPQLPLYWLSLSHWPVKICTRTKTLLVCRKTDAAAGKREQDCSVARLMSDVETGRTSTLYHSHCFDWLYWKVSHERDGKWPSTASTTSAWAINQCHSRDNSYSKWRLTQPQEPQMKWQHLYCSIVLQRPLVLKLCIIVCVDGSVHILNQLLSMIENRKWR